MKKTTRMLPVPFFTVRDQDKAYREMSGQMIHRLACDFRPTRRSNEIIP